MATDECVSTAAVEPYVGYEPPVGCTAGHTIGILVL